MNKDLQIGDLVQRITWEADQKKFGIVVELGSDLATDESWLQSVLLGDEPNEMVKVLWQGDYGTFWSKRKRLELIAKGNENV